MQPGLLSISISLFAGLAVAAGQGPATPGPGAPPAAAASESQMPPPMGQSRPPMERGGPMEHGGGPMGNRGPMEHRGAPHGRWWMDPAITQKLGLSAEQQNKVQQIFEQSRLKLIDLNAGLQKEEATLEPLLEGDRPDEAKVVSQIDRIAHARGELEKANARMLLGFRSVLTLDQWKKLQDDGPNGLPRGGPRR